MLVPVLFLLDFSFGGGRAVVCRVVCVRARVVAVSDLLFGFVVFSLFCCVDGKSPAQHRYTISYNTTIIIIVSEYQTTQQYEEIRMNVVQSLYIVSTASTVVYLLPAATDGTYHGYVGLYIQHRGSQAQAEIYWCAE